MRHQSTDAQKNEFIDMGRTRKREVFKYPLPPKRPFVGLLLFTNASVFQSCDLIGLPEYSRRGVKCGIFKINDIRQTGLTDFAPVDPIYLNLCTYKISPKCWSCQYSFL